MLSQNPSTMIADSEKRMSKQMDNEPPLNERKSMAGRSEVSGVKSQFQPVRVQELLEGMSESDDDECEVMDEADDEPESDDCQPLPRDNQELTSKSAVDSSLLIDSKKPKIEIVTEEPERSSISRSVSTNAYEYCSSTTSESHHSRQGDDYRQQEQIFPNDLTRSSSSVAKELSHADNERSSISRTASITGFTSDFGKMDIDSKTGRAVTICPASHLQSSAVLTSRSEVSDSVGVKKPEETILTSTSYSSRQTNIKFEAPDILHSSHERHIHSLTTYKTEHANGAHSQASISIFDVPIISTQIELPHPPATMSHSLSTSQLTLDTPMKHNPPAGSMRPMPSISHRNIFQTPQNKMPRDFPSNQSHTTTPATIFSHWSQNNMMHTPMQGRITDSVHTAGQPFPPKIESQWYRNVEGKGVRRPLAETMSSEHRPSVDNSSYKTHDPGDNQNRSPLEVIQEKATKPSILSQELKENRRPSSLECSTKREEPLSRASELNEANHNIIPVSTEAQPLREHYSSQSKIKNSRSMLESSTGKKEELLPRHSEPLEANHKVVPVSTEAPPQREHYSHPPSMQSRPNVQASVPSSIRKSQFGKTIVVKGREYMILGNLGQGMSGTVVRVQDHSNFDLKAIKIVDLSRMDKESAQSCVQEINMLAKLQAPCIIKMFDYEIKNHTIFVVMEMGETDLSKFLKSICVEKRPPLTMILYYWTEMLTAVKHIHDHGVIHSDLKPANFLLVRGRLKLIDFGIASTLNADMTSVVKNTTVGTLNYISPEALMNVDESPNQNGKYKINYKSDVWSLGCILYSLVYGQTPFQHIQNNWAKINAITNSDFKISFTQPANAEPVPSFLIDVIRKCLQRDPKARPSVAQLLEVRYMPSNRPNVPTLDVSSNILVKIKRALEDDEWREFTETMGHLRNA